MSEYNDFNWTDEQWEEWDKATVTIPADLLDALCSSADLLAKGARVKKENRSVWQVLAKKGYHYLTSIKFGIERMEHRE